MSYNWAKCSICGKYISFRDFTNGEAIRKLITPDSELTKEDWETIHVSCYKEKK